MSSGMKELKEMDPPDVLALYVWKGEIKVNA